MALFYYKEKKNKGIRAAAYLRLSIEDGDKAESNSIGNQRELIQNFVAERPELHLVGEYADDGYTGTNFERPGFTQMMEDIQSDKINCIIVKDLSRLGRNYIEMGKYLERIFPMMGIRFIAINDNYDNANTESSDSDSIVVYADYVAGAVDSEEYQQIREEYSRQYDSLRTALQRVEAKKMEVEQQIREYLNMTSNLEAHLDDFGFDAQLVKSLVQRIEVSADKRIRIVFGFQDVLADFGKESAGK